MCGSRWKAAGECCMNWQWILISLEDWLNVRIKDYCWARNRGNSLGPRHDGLVPACDISSVYVVEIPQSCIDERLAMNTGILTTLVDCQNQGLLLDRRGITHRGFILQIWFNINLRKKEKMAYLEEFLYRTLVTGGTLFWQVISSYCYDCQIIELLCSMRMGFIFLCHLNEIKMMLENADIFDVSSTRFKP